MIVLSRSDVQRAVPMPDAIAACRVAYAAISSGDCQVPQRIPITVPAAAPGAASAAPAPAVAATALFMPGYLPAAGGLGLKAVNVFPGNDALGLPIIHAAVLLFDPATGQPRALLEGGYLTALRTGASAAAAADLLARKDAATAAILGAGVQARTQLLGLCCVRPLRRARVYDTDRRRAEAYCAEMQPLLAAAGHRVAVEPAATAAEAVRDAGIVAAATTSRTPVLAAADLAPGAHVTGVGSYTPEMQEIGGDIIARAAKVVVDSRAAALAEAGDIIIPIRQGLFRADAIYAEIGELILGRRPARERDDELTVFKAVGHAALDLAVAALAVERARGLGLGAEVEV